MFKGFTISHSITEMPSKNPHALHTHDHYEIFYFLTGDITYYIEGHVYDISPHDILLINNKEVHKPIFHSDKVYERMVINFDESYVEPLSPFYDLTYCFLNRTLGHGNKIEGSYVKKLQLHDFFTKIHDYINEESIEDQLLAKTYFFQLLLQLNRVFKTDKEKFTKGYLKDQKIDTIIHYINSHLTEPLSLNSIEEACFVNKYYMSHLFKDLTGMTVIEYINHKRILLAKSLLQTDMAITKVAQETGFNDYSNFYKKFKDATGVSPSIFKKQLLK